jgi:hypothetical protein
VVGKPANKATKIWGIGHWCASQIPHIASATDDPATLIRHGSGDTRRLNRRLLDPSLLKLT